MENIKEVLENLKLADEYIQIEFPSISELKLVVIGGAAIILKGFKNKVTTDIDTIVALEENVADYLRSFAINNDAREVYVLPEGYESRLVEYKHKFKILRVFLPSNEDLVISKVGRYDIDDKEDLERTGILDRVDVPKLLSLGEEVAQSNREFKSNWAPFKKMSLFDGG